MKIRDETAGDEDRIAEVTTAAFAGADHASGTEAAIVSALRRAGALTLSLVAVDAAGADIVGHAAFSPVEIAEANGTWFGLGPVSVQPDRQSAGIGGALIREGLARLRAIGATGCVVLGDPGYYRRFGFESDGLLQYGDVPVEYMQRLLFDGAPPRGEVRYHPGFDAA